MEIKTKKKKSMCKAVVFLKATFIRLSTHGVLPQISFSTSKKLLLLLRFSVLYGRTWVFLPPPDASYPHGEVSRMHEETGNNTLERGPFPLFFFFFCDFSRGKWAREKGTAKSSSICMQKLRYFTECLRGRTPGEGHLFPFCLDLFSLSFLEHRVRCSFVSAGEGGRGGGREGEQGAACECIHYRETLLFPPSLLRLPWLPLSTLVPGSHGAWDNIEDGESLGTPLAKVMVRLV